MGKNKKKTHMPVRLNILFFVVFLLFSALILRLGVVQIVQGEDYQRKIERTVSVSSKTDAPRGIMYDRFGNVVVDNELVLSVTYTSRNTSNEEKLRVAKRLNDFIEVDLSSITERDKKDYWLITRTEEAKELVSREEMIELENDPMKIYRLQLDRITDEHLKEITEDELEVLAIKREFDRGYAHSPQRVKVGVTYKEAAQVLENLNELPGVDILRDSKRKYNYGNSFSAFVGNTGQIPREQIDRYLALGYDRSDHVGTSRLEEQYEDVLRGKKAVVEQTLDGSRKMIGAPRVKEGQRGKDLVLSVDMELQLAVEQIIADEVERVLANRGFINNGAAYVVMMDPHTGEILSMAGYDTSKSGNNHDLGVVHDAFVMGSAVKGATVLAGFEAGYANPGTVFFDRPIMIGQTRKSSFGGRSLGRINDLTALERSSNVYMFEIAMAFGNYHYASKRGGGLNDRTIGFNQMRYYFNQFGLGVKTGIDLPNEATGYNGGVQQLGNLLDYSIGQFDTYTPLQMAQYVSTIANGGYRVQPRFVREIREPSTVENELGNIVKQFSPTVLNRVDMKDEQIARVQEGFRLVVHGNQGTARVLANKPYKVAGKTGTAQVLNNKANNHTFVGYAPYDNPEVAFAVIVPYLKIADNFGRPANNITAQILDKYFDLKENRNGPNGDSLQENEDTEEETEE
ncbi:penicillin-binding protein 2 [Anaerobacillus sp. CMMVII]|uniref:peptidoglycan D,D-transpeptidase FtsI family protein n=1 Tax=Anaerobacillus sp. CMMVII TaxID=2755588 RepID=UPI0021B83A1E|nr:penicillin-binding protein 2 [Anaerobacillus sp. CMMVII]MCT8139722.1 penicillin-binding protein 2 [Anaerobacillus sp. CMMVII]